MSRFVLRRDFAMHVKLTLIFAVFVLLFASANSYGQNCIDLGGSNPLSHLQSFDGLGASPAPQNGDPINIQVLSPTAPRRYLGKFDNAVADDAGIVNVPGWALVEEGTSVTAVTGRYSTGDGSATAGNGYSFGSGPDRAFGSLNDDTIATNYLGGCFTNTTGVTIASITIAFTGEMWRRGAAGIQTDQLNFEYAVNATNTFAGAYTAHDPFDFVTPDVSGTAGARDGNSAPFRTVFPAAALPVSLTPGETLHVRWIDSNIAGSDDGLSIDDFSITLLPPSAANVTIGGRVLTNEGRGISKTVLGLTDSTGNVRYARTNSFGYYKFLDVAAGSSYIVSVVSKGYQFDVPSILLEPVESLTNVDFRAAPR